ncbi:hypothetical protein ACFONI_14600 [Aeromonas media]|uniref:hypothetical protein n=1 Tax=Aeromonas media TaxID=651 RepID=UPI00361D1EBC
MPICNMVISSFNIRMGLQFMARNRCASPLSSAEGGQELAFFMQARMLPQSRGRT